MLINTESRKVKFQKRFDGLESEYTSKGWKTSHQDLAKYINPTRGFFDGKSPNDGTMIDHQTLLDNHATQSSRILASGMQSGMTSPTKPWFKMGVARDDLNEDLEVRGWLDECTRRMLNVCNNSNIYGAFQSMYEEIGTFGTACCIILEDFDSVIRARSFTAGEYFLAVNERGVVDTFARKFSLTVGQMVRNFGYGNCSAEVQGFHDLNQIDKWIEVYHLIEPNDGRVSSPAAKDKPFRSVYWEKGTLEDKFLKESGFDEFPVLAPRWDTVTTQVTYGYGPGWFALGNTKQLQKTVLDKLLAQEKAHNPPMQSDSSVTGHVNTLPGGVTRTSANQPNMGVRPAYQLNLHLQSFLEAIGTLKEGIDKDFYVNIFLMLMQMDNTNKTATEIAEKKQEKLMMMGPILERLETEMLNPFIERLFGVMDRGGLLPVPPKQLEDMDLKIIYISILAQAQVAAGTDVIDKVLARAGELAGVDQSVIDNFDLDETMRGMAEMEGFPAKFLKTKEVVKQIREQRAKAAQMQAQMEQAEAMSKSAKNLSDAKLGEGNALDKISEQVPIG